MFPGFWHFLNIYSEFKWSTSTPSVLLIVHFTSHPPFHFYQRFQALCPSPLPLPRPAPAFPTAVQLGPHHFSLRPPKTSLCSLPTFLLYHCGLHRIKTNLKQTDHALSQSPSCSVAPELTCLRDMEIAIIKREWNRESEPPSSLSPYHKVCEFGPE